ncbi:Probable disease resistance protein At5g66900 [Linum perenne]
MAMLQDAFVGAVAGELLSAVKETLKKAIEFRSVLQDLQSTLESIIPLVQQIQGLNEKLGRNKSEMAAFVEEIQRGVQLVKKCSSIRWYTCWKRPRYRDKLKSLDEYLRNFCGLDLQLQQSVDIKETLVGVNLVLGRKPRNIKGYFVPEAIPNPVGFQIPLGELKMELFKDETSLLVLSAPPGCGKTTLAKLFCNDKDVKERFKDNILFIPVSKKETMEGIVQQVFQLKDQGDHTFRSEEEACYQLEQLLKNLGPTPILLVLDDVWPESVYLLEKLKFNIPGYKILVTSRSVYRNYTTYKLNPLNKKDSRTLFNNSAFLPDQQPTDIPEDVISQIVKECKGYPLALTVVGKSLRGQPVEEWRTRAVALTKAGPVSEGPELYSCLQKLEDAAVGAVAGELLKAVLNALQKAIEFRSVLQDLQSTLESIIPLVQQIQGLNEKLARNKSEMARFVEEIERGVQLVNKCSSIRWYTCWKMPKYRDKLRSLDEYLRNFCGLDLQLQQSVDIKEMLVGVNLVLDRKPRNIKGYFVPEAIPNPVGFQVPLGELKMELFKDDTSILVLSAPPGCGKTTLAKLFCNDNDVKERFKDNILYIPVSKKETMEGIVQQVFQLKDEGDPTFRTEDDACYQLEQLLKNIGPNPILLVLDDVWPDSVYLLEKLKFNIPGYKILVTSRSAYHNYKNYKLYPLNKKDSRTLFNNSAFDPDKQSPDIPEDVISQIVKQCKGYPLALTIVGNSLRGKPVEEWRTRAEALTKVGPVSEEENLYSCLQKSVDALDKPPTIKECFMDLALFSKDDLIPAAAVIDMWSELYKFDEDGVQAVAILHKLSARNLADLVVTRQHDLLRELIIYKSNLETFEQRERLILEIFRNEVPDWWTDTMQQLQSVHCHILSISTDEKFSGNWCKIQAPKLKALVLNFQTKSYALPEFLTGMDGMKVLMLMNYGISQAELTNFRVLGSLHNLKKIRLDRVSVPASLFTSLQFNMLEKITLVLCRLGQAFSPSNLHISYALPNVKEINIDYCKDLVELPLGVCELTNLKKLRITNCHNLIAVRADIQRLKNLEDLTLSSCIGLSELPETIGSLENLRNLDISECADVRTLPEKIGQLRKLSKIQMMGCSRNCQLPDSIQNLESLEEVGCDEDTAVLWEPFVHVLKNLRIKVRKEDINLNWLHGGRF